jgi:hypothetical protein
VAFQELLKAQREAGIADYTLGTYEAGPGYAMGGLNNQPKMTGEQIEAQDRAMKGQSGGTATLDTFLDKVYHGFGIQNFFTFGRRRSYWHSHARWEDGGQAYPCWKVLALFNNQGTGDVLRTETASVPTWDLPKFKRRAAVNDAPLAAVYATRDGDRFNVFVLSRKVDNHPVKGDDGYTPVTIDLPFASARSITLYRMAADPRAHNLDDDVVKVEKVDVPASEFAQSFVLNAARGADDRGLAPAATLLYVFEGTNAPAPR